MSANESRASTNVPPGALTALLRDVFRAPADPKAAPPALRPGETVGRFEIVAELGRGGFGVVYEARDRELGRVVALKAVRMGGDVELKEERLLREAEAAAQLSHPNIVTLFDLGRSERGPYLVMERLRGEDLGHRLAPGPLPVPDALRIAVEVARAVAHAHAHGVVHRDLTPGNVYLCSDGTVKVLDFGLAQALGRDRVHGGTRDYMAPEQRRGEPEDERTDVFALGVILHQMLAGAVPGPEAVGAPRAPPDPPGPPALAALVARMIDETAAHRPRDGGEVLSALTAIADGLTARPGPANVSRPARRRVLAVAALATAGAAGLAFVLAQRTAGVEEPLARPAPGPTSPVVLTGAADATPVPAPTAAPPAASPSDAPAPPRVAPARRQRTAAPPARRVVVECRDRVNAVATPDASTGDGVLTVDADPFAEAWIDGRAHGETPRECRVPAGTYSVRATHPRYGTREARIEVRPGERARFTADYLGPQ